MSTTQIPTPTPKGGRNKQRHTSSQHAHDQSEGRQLQPFFDESIAGDAIQPQQNGPARQKSKPKNAHKKPKAITPGKAQRHGQNLEPGPAIPPEQGYHSESGTAHYINGSGSRRGSMDDALQSSPYGHDGAVPLQRVVSSTGDLGGVVNGTPAKQVYAGPNFLASPAASSLPMPKAFAKTISTASLSPEPRNLTPSADPTQATPPDSDRSFFNQNGREGSPLDFLFSADKAERLRQTSSSASPVPSARPQLVSSRSSSSQPLRPTPLQDARSRSHGASPSRRNLLMQEMDGIDEQSDSPDQDETPSTASYKDRMDALRASSQGPPGEAAPKLSTLQETQTEALKQMLFKSQTPKSPEPSAPQTLLSPPRNRKAISIDIGSNNKYPQYGGLTPMRATSSHVPSQQPREVPPRQAPTEQGIAPSPALPPTSASPADVKLMEENLRKFLKIGF